MLLKPIWSWEIFVIYSKNLNLSKSIENIGITDMKESQLHRTEQLGISI